jgi:hypothetical protein
MSLKVSLVAALLAGVANAQGTAAENAQQPAAKGSAATRQIPAAPQEAEQKAPAHEGTASKSVQAPAAASQLAYGRRDRAQRHSDLRSGAHIDPGRGPG